MSKKVSTTIPEFFGYTSSFRILENSQTHIIKNIPQLK